MSTPELVDAREWGGAAVECDVCVVGTGAAGISAALRLQDHGLSVCLLEAGGTGPSDDARSEVECSDLPIGPESRNRWFGGSTNTWWGKVAPLDPIDFNQRDWVPLSGWPLTEEQLAIYWRQACDLMALPDVTSISAVDGRRGGETLLDGERLASKPFFWARRPIRFADLYRRRARRGTRLFHHAVVTGIELDQTGARVEQLRVATLSGARFDVRPRAVVLACGGIENPRLLLASNQRQPAGLGNAEDQVGRCFMEHPKGPGGTVAVAQAAPLPARTYWSGRSLDGVKVRLGLRLSEPWQARSGALNSYVLLDPSFSSAGVKALRRVYARKVTGRAAAGAIAGAARDIPEIAALLRFRLTNRGRLPAVRVQNFIEQPPNPSNRVQLTDRRDALGVPLPRLHWSVSDAERHTLVLLHQALASELSARGIGELDSPLLEDGDGDWRPTQDASHHMGTTRMGSDPRTSVVDPDGRVRGVTNLYVAGSSVFPTSGCANPTLTIVALALRLGDHLGRELRTATPSV